MNIIVSKIMGRASDLVEVEPAIALFLGAALLAVFLTTLITAKSPAEASGGAGLTWTLYATGFPFVRRRPASVVLSAELTL